MHLQEVYKIRFELQYDKLIEKPGLKVTKWVINPECVSFVGDNVYGVMMPECGCDLPNVGELTNMYESHDCKYTIAIVGLFMKAG